MKFKKFVCFCLAAIILSAAFAADNVRLVYGTGNFEDNTESITILDQPFSKNKENVDFSHQLYYQNMTAPDNTECIGISSDKGSSFGKLLTNAYTSGRYCVSFDFYSTGANVLFLYLFNSQNNIYSNASDYRMLQLRTDGKIELFRTSRLYSDEKSDVSYSFNEWHNITVWLDMDNREMIYKFDGQRIAEFKMCDWLDGFKGLSLAQVASSEAGYTYYKNFKIISEGYSDCAEFDRVYIKAVSSENVIGNNFSDTYPPEFDVSFINRTNQKFGGDYFCRVVDTDNREIYRSDEKSIFFAANENIKEKVNIAATRYGRLNLEIVLNINGEQSIRRIPYTMSKRKESEPVNKKSGIAAHINYRSDDKEDSFKLINRAGIGALRTELIAWSDVEKQRGVYNFTKEMDDCLNLLDKYDLFYINLWGNGNNAVYPNPDLNGHSEWSYLFPVSDDGLNGLSDFMYNYARFADGRIDVMEVWNEYNNMSGPYKSDYSYEAKYHKAVYNGISRAAADGIKGITVSGLDTDSWGLWGSNEVVSVLSKLNGEKVFDAVSLHPYHRKAYTDTAQNSAPETGVTKSLPLAIRDELAKYNQNSDIPIYFTESGWSDSFMSGDLELQAAYTVRQSALVTYEDIAETSCNYTLYDGYDRNAGIEKHFGILENNSDIDEDVPYLGKESYVALSYFNSLAAQAEAFEKVDLGLGDNGFGYHFKDRLQRDVYILGTVDNSERTVNLNLTGKNIYRTDMYGNEIPIGITNGTAEISVSGYPTYIITDDTGITECGQKDPNTVEVKLKGSKQQPYFIRVFAPKFTPENWKFGSDHGENAKKLVYVEQGMTDKNGNADISFCIDGESGEYTIEYRIGERIYENKSFIYLNPNAKDFVVTDFGWYMGDKKINDINRVDNESHITLKASVINRTGNEKEISLVCASYNDNGLSFININSYDGDEYAKIPSDSKIRDISIDITVDKTNTEKLKGFLFHNLKNIIPYSTSISLE